MECPSCGAFSGNSDCCADLRADTIEDPTSNQETLSLDHDLNMNSASDVPSQSQSRKSTLIEFPGVNRTTLPEWRKELSERVREVQERKAREAIEAAQVAQQKMEAEIQAPQLELLPPAQMPTMNPLVAAALKRIERAHQEAVPESTQRRNTLATALAYVPEREENEPEALLTVLPSEFNVKAEVEVHLSADVDALPQIERNHNLVVVPAIEQPPVEEKKPATSTAPPRRLIVDDPNDPALNYLDSISRTIRVDEIESRRPAAFRRLVCALFDLIICGLLAAPIAFAMRMTGTNLQDHRAIEVLAGCVVVITFIYLTLNTALTGRTWAMRLLSLRIIDIKTGLIPTGGQSLGRSLLYLISLGLAGLGIMTAVVNREGYTVHDRFTRTAVILT